MMKDPLGPEVLKRLADSQPTLQVFQARMILSALWDARSVELFDRSGAPVPDRATLVELMEQPIRMRVGFETELVPPPKRVAEPPARPSMGPRDVPIEEHHRVDAGSRMETSNRIESGNRVEAVSRPRPPQSESMMDRIISALESRERQRDFIWAGFVVNDLLPGLGSDRREAQEWFDLMVEQGIILLTKVPNPNNPDFPTTKVQLDRENETVRRVLQTEAPAKRFEPLAVRGDSASSTLLRERR